LFENTFVLQGSMGTDKCLPFECVCVLQQYGWRCCAIYMVNFDYFFSNYFI